MSSVKADPKDIRKFQSGLRRFNGELESITGRLQGQLRSLSSTWQDAEYRKFEGQMNEVMGAFRRYLSQSNDYINYLDSKARPLEQYQGNQ